jgi:hypothetical protein
VKPNAEEEMHYALFLIPYFRNLTVLEETEQTSCVFFTPCLFYTVRTAELILSYLSLVRRTCFAEYQKFAFPVLRIYFVIVKF